MSRVIERFLRYVQIDTESNEESNTVPSTPGQLAFARQLGQELKDIGLKEVTVDQNAYVMATLPANIEKEIPVLGFVAHIDTSPDMPGSNVRPRIVTNYDGEDIVLNQEKNIVLSPGYFPSLKAYVGQDLITTDGTTLLGADDKAGIAEIVTAVEYLIKNPALPHGKIRIGFTPDEEIGRGADHFDIEQFGADLAYTLDGGPLGELEYENFNAAAAKITINGISVHPGTAKGKMINSQLIAAELIGMLPEEETPTHTEGYQGFYHLVKMQGNVEQTRLNYIIRDFERSGFSSRKAVIQGIVEQLNDKYGQGSAVLQLKDQYYNMKEIVEKNQEIIAIAEEAMKDVGIKPLINPIRGGTDGARFSYMGLPTPNLFTGGHNYHGKFEYIPTMAMEKAVEVVLKIIELAVNKY